MTYAGGIAETLVKSNKEDQCKVAQCLAFCVNNACESQCDDQFESTDESFLAEISWTKEMCDTESAKASVKEQCETIKTGSEGCDANCDSASGAHFLPLVLMLPLMYFI